MYQTHEGRTQIKKDQQYKKESANVEHQMCLFQKKLNWDQTLHSQKYLIILFADFVRANR